MSEEMYQFLGRVHTFVLGSWLYQSSQLSPYVLASRGFQYHSIHIIECHICHTQISFEHLKIGDDNHRQQQKILQQLKQHNKDCIYSGVNIKDQDLYTLKRQQLFNNIGSIFSKIKDTYTFYKGKLPKISQASWDNYVSKYQTVFSKNNPKFQDGKQIDLVKLLSIFGWQLIKQQSPKLICNFCGRVVHIQQYQTTQSQRLKILAENKNCAQNKYFEPIQNHRYFCIWGHFNDFDQSSDTIYGWQICLKYLLNKLLDVEKGWAQRQKFHEVTQIKQQFSKLIQDFSQKTKNSMIKFNELINPINVQGSDYKQTYNKKMLQTKQTVQNILDEVDGIVKPLAKKIKYS